MWAVVAIGVAAGAQPPPTVRPPTTMTVQKQTTVKKVEVFTPLTLKRPPSPADQNRVERVDGLSSQPWYKTIGPRPGWSAFPSPEQQDPAFNLFWFGATPR